MEDCKICFSNESNRMLPCSHSLCSVCCVKLNTPICPYCRQTFIYTAEEIKERIKLGILSGYKWEASPGFAFRPQDWIEHRQLNNYIIIDVTVCVFLYNELLLMLCGDRGWALGQIWRVM